MNVYLNRIDGIDDAIVSMLFSKRSWTKETENRIRNINRMVNEPIGRYIPQDSVFASQNEKLYEEYNDYLDKVLKWGTKHITLLKFIDISVTVEGIHRAGQDDWDAHAQRFQNRIVRSSTRLATFDEGEVSEFYVDKIMSTDTVLKALGLEVPEHVTREDGTKFVKTVNGYIREDLKENKDVLRGLYMLSIPSNFIFCCNLADWAHVYKERGKHGGANPEVKYLAEEIADQLELFQPKFTREVWMKVQN